MRYSKKNFLILGLVCIFSACYFLYKYNFSRKASQELILSEEQEEFKKRPAEPGGIIVPNSNSLIYEKLNSRIPAESRTHLLPDTEEPMKLGFKTGSENIEMHDSIDEILAKLDLEQEDKTVQQTTGGKENISDGAPSLIPSSSENSVSAYTGDLASSEGKRDLADHGLKIFRMAEESNKLYNLNINSINAAGSGYRIQLSSAWSEADAKSEWKKIKARHIKHLKNSELIIKKVRANNGKIIYLVMAGNYHSLNQAKLICKKLNLSKQNCIVTK